MKFTKVVILAGALAVSTVPQIAHSQDAATSVTSQDSRVAEWSKNVGMHCTITESRNYTQTPDGVKTPVEKPFEVTYKGILSKVTDSTIEVNYLKLDMSKGKRRTEILTWSIPMKDVARVEFDEKTKVAPPAKIVFPASAFIRQPVSTADDSQTVVPPTIFEVEKVAKLQQVVGKNCQVRLNGDKLEDFHEGTVKSVTVDWIILENEGEEEENGKTVKVKNRIHLPSKKVSSITSHGNELSSTNPYKAKQSSK